MSLDCPQISAVALIPLCPSLAQGPLLMKWRGRFAVKLNISDEEAQDWFIEQVRTLQRRVEVNYITLEVGVGSPYLWQAQHHSCRLCGDEYINQFALLAQKLGNATIISAATRYVCLKPTMLSKQLPRLQTEN